MAAVLTRPTLPSLRSLFYKELQLANPQAPRYYSYPSPEPESARSNSFSAEDRIRSNSFSIDSRGRANSLTVDREYSMSPPYESADSRFHYPERKERKRTTEAQLVALLAMQEITPIPSRLDREKLSSEIGMSPRAIQVWFQNKRQLIKNR
jgi:hypothetical protein